MSPIINLTPHELNFYKEKNGKFIEFKKIAPENAPPIRLSEKIEPKGEIEGIPLIKKEYGKIENLPDKILNEGCYVVSGLVFSAIKDSDIKRKDFCTIGELLRDDNGNLNKKRGRVVGALSLVKLE